MGGTFVNTAGGSDGDLAAATSNVLGVGLLATRASWVEIETVAVLD